ncbi:hypothetical protein TPA0910_61610 [Streptomyces hygroscopicus subsp. sporocinereus]|uniref:Lipoprotein n=1 Tax=Streptomyces hygroscopicus TaxID=1912 RepID=A0ABQ3U7Z1_STRHY|nr:hypothetical protein TPA0910_61610 [Streptomyces hygroscopicus]
MTRWGKSGPRGIAAAVAPLPAVAGCGDREAGGPSTSKPGFRHYAGAVQYPAVTKGSGGEQRRPVDERHARPPRGRSSRGVWRAPGARRAVSR